MSKSEGPVGGNGARWEVTLRASRFKGNMEISRRVATRQAMSCGEAELEQESSQRTAGGGRRSRAWSGASKISDDVKPHSGCVGAPDLLACSDSCDKKMQTWYISSGIICTYIYSWCFCSLFHLRTCGIN